MLRSRSPLLLVLLAFAACGGDASTENASTTVPGSGSEIVSIAIDPSDGTLLAGSGPAFFRLSPGAKQPETAAGNLKTPKGSGTLTRDVVARFAADGTIIASGHSGEAALPSVLGLVKSSDAGETWESVSGLGEADYHEIELDGSRILALKNEEPGLIQVSDDGGKTWDTREAPSAATPIDVAVDPGNAAQWAVSTDQGTFISTNDGKTWRQRDTTFGARIAWAPDKLYSAGKDGKVRLARTAVRAGSRSARSAPGRRSSWSARRARSTRRSPAARSAVRPTAAPPGRRSSPSAGIREAIPCRRSRRRTRPMLETMAFERDGIGHEEIRPGHSGLLAVGTLACPRCDLPVAPGDDALMLQDVVACAYCGHAGVVRDFLSLATPTRPARVEISLRLRGLSWRG